MRARLWLCILVCFLVVGLAAGAREQTPSVAASAQREIVQTPSVRVLQTETPMRDARQEESNPMVVVFFEDGCTMCEIMNDLLDQLLVGHEDVVVSRHDVGSPGSRQLEWQLAAYYKIRPAELPLIFVGEEVIIGAGRSQEIKLRTAIGDCLQRKCTSPMLHVEQGKQFFRDLMIIGGFIGLFIALLVFQGM